MRDKVEVRLEAPSLPSKKKIRQRRVVGDDLCRDDGKYKYLERVIDRDNDRYKEVITDPETGEVIHYCNERLSEHRGHGSAKKRPT